MCDLKARESPCKCCISKQNLLSLGQCFSNMQHLAKLDGRISKVDILCKCATGFKSFTSVQRNLLETFKFQSKVFHTRFNSHEVAQVVM